jgi:hypothetical protein
VSSGKHIHHFVAMEFIGHNFTVREISVQRFELYLDISRYLRNAMFILHIEE